MATGKTSKPRRKKSEIGTHRAHVGAPHNQPFNVKAKPSTKRRSWWNGYASTLPRKQEEASV